MIKPAQSGAALLRDIRETRAEPGQMAMWWLGQSGYAIRTASTYVYVDLYLSEHLTAKYAGTEKPHIRMTEAPIRGADITDADVIFASHKHSDHLDPGTLPDLFASSPDARLVLPLALVGHATKSVGLAELRLIPVRGDDTINIGPLAVHILPSAHPGLDYDEATGYPFLGFVFQVDGVTAYHSGDTIVYDGLAERLAAFQPDVMFLPINGTDTRRAELHVPPNMNAREAVDLAQAVNPDALVIPHHYDMFTFNTVDVRTFTEYADVQGQPYRVLECGERFIYGQA